MAISILVRNPESEHKGCRILYRDIVDCLKREEKLRAVRDWASIEGVQDWQEISLNAHHDWIDQRDEDFQNLYPMGSKDAKSGREDRSVFQLYSRGLATSRDAYLYNFSASECAENAKRVTEDYMGAMRLAEERADYRVDEIIRPHQAHVRWDRELKNNLRRGNHVKFSTERVWHTHYRPFVKQNCYVDYVLVNTKYQQDRIFPTADTENRAICVTGIGSTKPFSALVVNRMPDLELISKGQCFPRYRFEHSSETQPELFDDPTSLTRVDNITDHALKTFRTHYGRNSITKDDIFNYVYGILNAPAYRARFEHSLSKELPRIPFAPDFDAFAKAGNELVELHLGYETCPEWPLRIEFSGSGSPEPHHYRVDGKGMRFADEARAELIVNEHIRLKEIPPAAHWYVVNGRTPLEWLIDRYRITKDKHSGIVNDPNNWFEDPKELLYSIGRVAYVSVLSAERQLLMPDAISDDDVAANKTKAHMENLRSAAAGVVSNIPGERYELAFLESIIDWDFILGEGEEGLEQ